jgi:hypothetical protein
MRLDDIWFAGFLVAEGAQLKQVAVLPYSNGRMQAFFELEEVCPEAVESYAAGNPKVAVHALRTALNELRQAMRAALAARNGNGTNQNNEPKTNQTRSVSDENPSGNNRFHQSNNRSGGLHPPVRKAR